MNGLPISHSGPLLYIPMDISSLYISTYISNLIHILYVHKIKIKYFFLQNSPNMCPKHRIIREKLNTKWANKFHMSKRLLYCFAGKHLVMKLTYISSNFNTMDTFNFLKFSLRLSYFMSICLFRLSQSLSLEKKIIAELSLKSLKVSS